MSPITWIAAHVRGSNRACGIYFSHNAAWRAYRDAGGLSSSRQFLRVLRDRYPWQVVTLLP